MNDTQAQARDAQWDFWNASLKWREHPDPAKAPDFDPRKPESGFYRGQRDEAVAIWRKTVVPPTIHCLVYTRAAEPRRYRPDQIDQIADYVFAYCCRHPISREAFMAFKETRRWPEDVGPPQAGDNLPEDEAAQIRTLLDDLWEQYTTWFNKIGGKIDNQPDADKVGNYAAEFQKLENRANDHKRDERAPHDAAIRVILDTWQPLVTDADQHKRVCKERGLDWLQAQRKKAEAERAEQEAKRKAALAQNQPPPPDLHRSQRTKTTIGTSGSISLRSTTVYPISDYALAVGFLLAQSPPPQDLLDAIQVCVNRLMKAGKQVPGVTVGSKDIVS